MNEQGPSHFEEHAERAPSEEEVLWLFRGLVGETSYQETSRREDEKGLCLLEIVITEGDGQREYTYERKRREGWPETATIYTTPYDSDGMPLGGESVAKLVGGDWRMTPRGPFETTKKFV